jgi:quercetin dioxygenase-like cupin family protein
MPIEIRRFGVGHRTASGGLPGDEGVTGRLIHSDARGVISELAFERGGRIEPHSNPNTTYFVVIEGGGWTLVGDERLRVAAGEAVLWPPDEIHGAWTDYSHMRAIVVEFAGPDDSAMRGILEGSARELLPGEAHASPADGELAPRVDAGPHDRTEGEPL